MIKLTFANSRLKRAYIALQAWKKAIYSDLHNVTANWVSENVYAYNGILCTPTHDNPKLIVVLGVYINHGDIAGYLPVELGLLTDLTIFHINYNWFCGIIPNSFSKHQHFEELDVSNNRFVGSFPDVLLELHSLVYIDIRYNNFEGPIPAKLFDKKYNVLFLTHNRLTSEIPDLCEWKCGKASPPPTPSKSYIQPPISKLPPSTPPTPISQSSPPLTPSTPTPPTSTLPSPTSQTLPPPTPSKSYTPPPTPTPLSQSSKLSPPSKEGKTYISPPFPSHQHQLR
ncbi:leucine-rich repeat extensin-like protein 5 [Cornus florida]|uniref:leucine-rich repeat extensin-like protein 5 n=1 Tax=Cornus florida TaxID=4283 RepID=UPI00289A0623|nr:leucine-rich repeat extensin-like protein 5 [Cornus florida]